MDIYCDFSQTPILPPSHSPCAVITPPHPPLTSTPIVQQQWPSASKRDISTRQPNQRVSALSITPLIVIILSHYIQYPITSTPILPSHAHHIPNNLTDILESEMRRENVNSTYKQLFLYNHLNNEKCLVQTSPLFRGVQ